MLQVTPAPEPSQVEADNRLLPSPPRQLGQPKTMAHLLHALEQHDLSQEEFLSELCELRVDSMNPATSDTMIDGEFSPYMAAAQA